MRKKMFIVLLAMVIIFALNSSLYAQETDPAKVLSTLADSLNAGDVDAAMPLFAPDSVINILPPLPGLSDTYTGLKEIRGFFRNSCGDGAQDRRRGNASGGGRQSKNKNKNFLESYPRA